MSIRLMSEVWKTDLPLVEKMVLLVIADHASDEGTDAWPSQATMATKASISIRTVQRTVNSLVAKGYIWMEKGAGGSANCRDDRRPHRYTIHIKKLRGDNVTTRSPRGDNDDMNEATITPSTGRLSRPMKHPNEPSNETPDDFALFWKIYPLKVGKQAAAKAWVKAIKEAKAEEIMAGAYRYANDPNRHPSFTAHASTWLNAGRWNDDPLPARIKSVEEVKAEQLAKLRQRAEAEKAEADRYFAELDEQKKKAVAMPAEVKQLLREIRHR